MNESFQIAEMDRKANEIIQNIDVRFNLFLLLSVSLSLFEIY
jgi:hypothetical protein